MGLSTAGKNKILDALGATHLSGHNGAPADNGANELTGGTYARKAVSYAAAAAGSKATSVNVTFDIPAGQSITHVGIWDALTGGNYLGSYDVTDEAYVSAGQYIFNSGSAINLT